MRTETKSDGILLESGTNEVEFFEFSVAGSCLGVNVNKVLQVTTLSQHKLTRCPNSPPASAGVIKIRESVIPVVDLRVCLDLIEHPSPEDQLLLITKFNQHDYALLIDSVAGIQRASWQDFKTVSPAINHYTRHQNLSGTVTLKDRIMMILNLEALLGDLDPAININRFTDRIQSSTSIDRSQIRLLFAEDSRFIQTVTVKALVKSGFRKPVTFSTGTAALQYILENADSPKIDAVLSDIEMPEMDGLTLCRRLRELPAWSEIPVIFYSSMISTQMEEKCLMVGGNACLSKPRIHEIAAVIDDCYARAIGESGP